MSNHYKITVDESIDKLLDENFCLGWQDTDNLYENKKTTFSCFELGKTFSFHGTNIFLTAQNY